MHRYTVISRQWSSLQFPAKMAALAFAALLLEVPSMAANQLVPDTYPTITAAVNASANNDQIHITTAGTYAGFAINTKNISVIADVSGVIINSTINIDGAANVTMQGLKVQGPGVQVQTNSSGSVTTLQSCELTGGANQGVSVNAPNTVNILNCQIHNNGTFGVVVNGTGANGCTINIKDSSLNDNSQNGIAFYGRGNVNLDNTLVNHNALMNVRFNGGSNGSVFTAINGSQINSAQGSSSGFYVSVPVWINLTDTQVNGNTYNGFQLDANANGTGLVATNCQIKSNTNDGIGAYRDATISLSGTEVSQNGGQGIQANYFPGGVTLSATNCNISTNTGSGIYCNLSTASTSFPLTLASTTVSGNGNYGIFEYINAAGLQAPLSISHSSISTNNYAGLYMNATVSGAACQTTITDTDFTKNKQYAAFINGWAWTTTADIERCKFVDGSGNGYQNLWLRETREANVFNCVFDEGYCGLYLANGFKTKVYHCTFVSRAGYSSIGIQADWSPSANHEIKNCIIDGYVNGIYGGPAGGGTNPINSNNLIRCTNPFAGAATNGTNNRIGLNPLFTTGTTGPGTGDFHLASGSAAPGYGVDLGIATDIEGTARPLTAGSNPDIGAYESVYTPVTLSSFNME